MAVILSLRAAAGLITSRHQVSVIATPSSVATADRLRDPSGWHNTSCGSYSDCRQRIPVYTIATPIYPQCRRNLKRRVQSPFLYCYLCSFFSDFATPAVQPSAQFTPRLLSGVRMDGWQRGWSQGGVPGPLMVILALCRARSNMTSAADWGSTRTGRGVAIFLATPSPPRKRTPHVRYGSEIRSRHRVLGMLPAPDAHNIPGGPFGNLPQALLG